MDLMAYNRLNATDVGFFFSLESYSLLKNFSTAQTTKALNYAYIVKEYLIVVDGGILTINFTPSTNSSNAYAFVNGIEVMSMPDIYRFVDGTLIWTPDVRSKFLFPAKSSTSKAATQNPLVPEVPYMTARVSHSEFSYSFPVVLGQKFVHLHFCSNSYNGRDATNSVISFTAYNRLNAIDARFFFSPGSYSLFKNCSTVQTTKALNYAYIVKEYLIIVDGGILTIKFTPSTNSSNAYAFVNGIEVMSMPNIYRSVDGTLMSVGLNYPIYIDNTTTLENVYRINVGGNDISPSDDTSLFRSWYDNQPYIHGEAFGVHVSTDQNRTIITYHKYMPT
ncbi:hypothetical protein Q3G72_007317 [Acer saccharum]|nr:hypothetical protein Q3G72_007317 [Acer saccharum]